MRRFEPGEAVALREIWHGHIWAARPLTVVADDDDLMMFFLPIGAEWLAPGPEVEDLVRARVSNAWTTSRRRWEDTYVLSFTWPGAGHAVLHFWNEDWTPRSWYVNVQRPLRRFELGFDTADQDLDVVVEADLSGWRWKDEDQVALGIDLGLYAEADGMAFRREAERGVRRLLEREPPFDRDWTDWRPDPSWTPAELPAGWDRL